MRGTSGPLRHTRLTRYRCSLPGLAGFAGNRCTEPEVPRIGRGFESSPASGSLAYRSVRRKARDEGRRSLLKIAPITFCSLRLAAISRRAGFLMHPAGGSRRLQTWRFGTIPLDFLATISSFEVSYRRVRFLRTRPVQIAICTGSAAPADDSTKRSSPSSRQNRDSGPRRNE